MNSLFGADAPRGAVLTALDRLHSSYAILISLVAIAVLALVLHQLGAIGFVVRAVSAAVRGGTAAGFRVWERLFSWAPWPLFLALVLILLAAGSFSASSAPWFTVAAGLLTVVMGVSACLAYMAIDVERYEVERGYKAIHNPLKGQLLATNLVRHGWRVGVPLLAAAAVAAVGGFALLNLGLYATVGAGWYAVGDEQTLPEFADFLVYALVHLYRLVDMLDLTMTQNMMRFTVVRPTLWPAGLLLGAYKTFFTLVLLQQLFASIRQSRALAESIADFWSPHPPIHERARNALPQYGVGVVGPLLESLREVPALTKELRDQLPAVLAGIGPAAIPALVGHLADPDEGERAVSVAALGLLGAVDALPAVAALATDASALVRLEAVRALGAIGDTGLRAADRQARVMRPGRPPRRWPFRRPAIEINRAELVVSALRAALADATVGVRVAAARALGLVGKVAAPAAPDLIARLRADEEPVQCAAAEALGRIGDESGVQPLAEALAHPTATVRAAAARALGAYGENARPAVPALVPLLRDSDEDVRHAAGDALGRTGELPHEATAALVEGLANPDTHVQVQTAEALAKIGETAAEAAPALAAALENGNELVRAKAAEALGKMGETAAEAAVPTLIRALRDDDGWVSAVAAEALGEMGEAAEDAVPALVRSLSHISPLVRARAAEALGKLNSAATPAVPALERAATDTDGGVREQALRALGAVVHGAEAEPLLLAGLRDPEPRVRAAAAEAFGKRGTPHAGATAELVRLLDDANDEVKFRSIAALARVAGPLPEVIDGLCRRLTDDGSVWVRETAAQHLGALGAPAASAGPALLRAARTAEEALREQAVRALILIRPPELEEALTGAMTDPSPAVRKVATAGWMKADAVPGAAVAVLVEALRDPEVQVRANAAHALGRLDALPPAAVPGLTECAAHPNDGLRLNAAVALRNAPNATSTLAGLIGDPNSRVRLIAAGAVLARTPDDAPATQAVVAALSDPSLRLRQVGFEVVAALGDRAGSFRAALAARATDETDADLRARIAELLARLAPPAE